VSAAASAGARRQLDALGRSHPETGPWLALVEAVLDAVPDPAWDAAAVETTLGQDHPTPVALLTGATIPLPRPVADALVRRLLRLAADAGGANAPLLAGAAAAPELDARGLLEAAIDQDEARLAEVALGFGVDPEALAAIAQVATVPLLQACRRRFATAVAPGWDAGHCPICAAWPALAETRGLERSRRLRCARCGADWGAPAMRCVYCGTDDHAKLGSLVPEERGEARKVETCTTCHGYLKSIATLRPWAGDEVGLADLASVELDLAALEHEYGRPTTPAARLDVRLVALGADLAPGAAS